MNTLKIGWIGLGNMGNPMVQNLLKAGYSVTVFNRSLRQRSSTNRFRAYLSHKSEKLIETCDLVITMLSNDAAVKEVFCK
jgi:3-hydroxyisobutyrate dehydrogenase